MKHIVRNSIAAAAIASFSVITAIPASADNASTIKQRMEQRLPQIDSLKTQGVIGENNAGYLAVLKDNASAKALADAENKDRAAVYQAIAKKTGTSADLVGKRRAAQIAEIAGPGQMIQDAAGKWLKK